MLSKQDSVKKLLKKNSSITYKDVMAKLDVSQGYASALLSKARQELAHELARDEKPVWTVVEDIADVASTIVDVEGEYVDDVINHPSHYKIGGIEVIDFIEAKGFNYRIGNVVKYLSRAGHKGDYLENLRKAQWYLEREIEKEELAS